MLPVVLHYLEIRKRLFLPVADDGHRGSSAAGKVSLVPKAATGPPPFAARGHSSLVRVHAPPLPERSVSSKLCCMSIVFFLLLLSLLSQAADTLAARFKDIERGAAKRGQQQGRDPQPPHIHLCTTRGSCAKPAAQQATVVRLLVGIRVSNLANRLVPGASTGC